MSRAVNLPRRAVPGGAGATVALPGATIPAGADDGLDAELIRLLPILRTEQAFLDRWNADDGVDWDDGEAANARWWNVVRQIADAPAQSPAGIRTKAEALQSALRLLGDDGGHGLAASLAADLLRLHG